MTKNLLEDMVRTKRMRKEEAPEEIERPELRERFYLEENKKNRGSQYALWFVALVAVVFLFFAVSFVFSGAKVIVNPKAKDLAFSESLSAVKDSNTDNLSFDLVVISGEEKKTMQGGEEKDVSEKAQGAVLIYNAFSSSSQTLSVDTRLEGSNGKIYKTKTKIVVPGMTKNGIPGSVEVEIYAIEAGEEYNSDPLDFKIFGFKGTSKYDKFYARSKGKITGGLVGKFRQISDVEKTTAVNELKDVLQAKLSKKVIDQIPSGFVLFKDSTFLNIDDENVDYASADGIVSVDVEGTLYGFLFNERKLTKKIIETDTETYDVDDVFISNIKDLTFSLPAQAGLANKDAVSFTDVKNITFTLSGAPKIVWKVDTENLAGDLLGKQKKDFYQILSQYPNIKSADLSLKPAWKTSFPDKSKDIKIIVNYPE